MPSPTVVVALLAAIAPAATQVPEIPEQVRAFLPWIATAAFLFTTVAVIKANEAIWCAFFTASAVLFNPFFPCPIPEPGNFWTHIAAAITGAVYAVRKW